MFGWTSKEKLTHILFKIDDKKELSKLLSDILTSSEIDEIAQRIKICELLQDGMTQRNIAKKLGISITTVTRGSKVMQEKKSVIWKYL